MKKPTNWIKGSCIFGSRIFGFGLRLQHVYTQLHTAKNEMRIKTKWSEWKEEKER